MHGTGVSDDGGDGCGRGLLRAGPWAFAIQQRRGERARGGFADGPGLNAVTPLRRMRRRTASWRFRRGRRFPARERARRRCPPQRSRPRRYRRRARIPHAHVGLGQGATSRPARSASGRIDVPQTLNVQDAILVGLQNNISLRVNRYNVPIARTQEEAQRAAFDPSINGQIAGVQSRDAQIRREQRTHRVSAVHLGQCGDQRVSPDGHHAQREYQQRQHVLFRWLGDDERGREHYAKILRRLRP